MKNDDYFPNPYEVDEVWIPHDRRTVKCDDCGWTGDVADCLPIRVCSLTAGDPSPAGRCPRKFTEDDGGGECLALCYVI